MGKRERHCTVDVFQFAIQIRFAKRARFWQVIECVKAYGNPRVRGGSSA